MGGAHLSEAETVMELIFLHRFGTPAHPPPDLIVVSIGGNLITSRVVPSVVLSGHDTIAEGVAQDLRWVLTGMTMYAAREEKAPGADV